MASSFTQRFQNDEILRRVLNSTSEYAVFTLDPEGIVTTWNDGARRIKGYEADEIVGRNFRVLYVPEDQEAGHPEHNLRVALKNGEYREEHIRMKKDGSTFEADVDISPIFDEEGAHAGFLKVVHDVSARRRLERELEASRAELERRVQTRTAELHASNQELEAFSYSIAHDLRGPIRGIIARSRMTEEDFGPEMPEGARDQLRAVVATAKRLAELVDDLLEFARLGRKPLVRKRVDITALARRLADEILPTCHQGSARVEVEDGLWAEADPPLLETALRNLIENSCKYSERAVSVRVGRSTDGGEAAFYVQDDGIGFDMRYVHKLFLPFERLHRDGEIEGTGIGLANVRRIVERHGGKIWAEAEPGKGATFWFTLS